MVQYWGASLQVAAQGAVSAGCTFVFISNLCSCGNWVLDAGRCVVWLADIERVREWGIGGGGCLDS